jgi:tRNA pseudouridine65 synthase
MTELEPFPILFEDEYLVAINKPAGILVHKTSMSEDKVFVLQLLRDQLGGERIFTTHRIDRGTSGVLVFDYALADKETKKAHLEAVTRYIPLGTSEIDAAIGLRYPTARFSLVEAYPETGRRHQIRKHFAHINHPIIGDVRHGDVKQNKYFRDVFLHKRMMLHAAAMAFQHPDNQTIVKIEAPVDEQFREGLKLAQLNHLI